jgi:GNAT superfamily N-acetyltransferase
MGKGIVVSCDRDMLGRVRPVIENKFRDDMFFAPFLFGHSLYYVPECNTMKRLPCPDGFTVHVLEGRGVYGLYEYPDFINALQYNKNSAHPDHLALYAMRENEIAGIAAASIDSEIMWQIGIDVLPPYRNIGLASYLVSNLAVMIMERGALPYYGTASSNIASQKTAYRSGFIVSWMCNYKNTLDGRSPFNS